MYSRCSCLHLALTDLSKHSVRSVCFSADGDLLVSGSDDKTLKVWSIGSSGTFECESTLNVDGSISSLDFSPCGTKIAAACNDIYPGMTGHSGRVTQLEFSDADTVVSSSNNRYDGTTRVWDVGTGTQKTEFEGDKFSFTRSSGVEQTVSA